jgi:hypothetical protein
MKFHASTWESAFEFSSLFVMNEFMLFSRGLAPLKQRRKTNKTQHS